MRDIKFRAWSSELGKYSKTFSIENNLLNFTDAKGLGRIKSMTDEEIEQFTGLTDKNGVDIYEGDLIKLYKCETGYTTVVFENAYVGGWVLYHGVKDKVSLGARHPKDIEVIGNIHQNPELLEVKE